MRSHPDYYIETGVIEAQLVCHHCDHEWEEPVEAEHDARPGPMARRGIWSTTQIWCPACGEAQEPDFINQQLAEEVAP